ncbi:MAG: alpha-glucosidase/alpha-galactosidase, partial [Ruminococcus sp.]|nr:alpha-glucosidase/alpha-galactosidase [Candidatus Apopatosoma intestinale]
DLPIGSIVETNCLFERDRLTPCKASPLPPAVLPLVARNAMNIEALYDGIKHRDFDVIFESFLNQPLCSSLSVDQAHELFRSMALATSEYLKPYYDLSLMK